MRAFYVYILVLSAFGLRASDTLLIKEYGASSLRVVYQNPDSARFFVSMAKELCEREQDDGMWAVTYNYEGIYYDVTGEYDSARACYLNAFSLARKTGRSTLAASALNNVGLLFWNQNNLDSALVYYFKALDIYEETRSPQGIGNVYSNIGLIYNSQYRNEESLDYARKSLHIRREIHDTVGIGKSLANIGGALEKMGHYDSSLYYKNLAKPFFRATSDWYNLSTVLHDIAVTYHLTNRIEEAIVSAEEALLMREKLGSKKYIASTLNLLGGLYRKKGKYDDSHAALDRAIAIYQKYGVMRELSGAYERKAITYREQNDFENAVLFYEKRNSITDSLYGEDKIKSLFEIEQKYKSEKAKTALLEKDKELIISQQRSAYLLFGILGLLAFVIAVFLFFRNRIKKNRERKRQELLEQKLEISRELHDNIGSQLTYISMGLNTASKLPDDKRSLKLEEVKEFASTTISDLRTTVWGLNKNVNATDLATKIGSEIVKIKSASALPIVFDHKVDERLLSSTVAINVFRIVQEALQNACKHAQASSIEVSLYYEGDEMQVEVKDDGIGLGDDDSTGFGLQSMRQRAERIGAILDIQSYEGNGTTVKLRVN